jgi:hypothetical protein
MLLVLLAVALPTVALAQNFPSFPTGTFMMQGNGGTSEVAGTGRNTTGGFNTGSSPIFVVVGNLNRVRLDEKTISSGCATADGDCTFSSGQVVVSNAGNIRVFQGPIENGMMDIHGNDVDITADLTPVGAPCFPPPSQGQPDCAPRGAFVTMDLTLANPPLTGLGSVVGGTGFVGTPEPGTLCLLGTSVIGLAGMARRRFKLGK